MESKKHSYENCIFSGLVCAFIVRSDLDISLTFNVGVETFHYFRRVREKVHFMMILERFGGDDDEKGSEIE